MEYKVGDRVAILTWLPRKNNIGPPVSSLATIVAKETRRTAQDCFYLKADDLKAVKQAGFHLSEQLKSSEHNAYLFHFSRFRPLTDLENIKDAMNEGKGE